MLKTLKDLFDALRTPAATEAEASHTLQVATAVMLVEVMRADAEMTDAERDAVMAGLRDKFALADDELATLVAQAQQASH